MIRQIIKALGYNSNQFEEQIYDNNVDLILCGHMWDVEHDIVLDILYNEFFDDVEGACDIVNMLEEKFEYSDYLYYAIVFRDQNIK